ncbi:MAG: ABC transporter ATP-binding protein [Marinicellaceae bacterium]
MIKIEKLIFKYDKNQKHNTISVPFWEVKAKENIYISGPSGSGKSTLIHLLSGLIEPISGSIIIDKTHINKLSTHKKNNFRANNIGLISQQFNLIPYLSVIENIELAGSFQSKKPVNIKDDVEQAMDKLGLDRHYLDKKASALSFGQQQRVAIIRALINKPKLLLADEPTSALDHSAKHKFIEMLKEMSMAYGITLLFISHDTSLKSHFDLNIDMDELNVI